MFNAADGENDQQQVTENDMSSALTWTPSCRHPPTAVPGHGKQRGRGRGLSNMVALTDTPSGRVGSDMS